MLAATTFRNLTFKNSRFLVVEDEEITRTLISGILRGLDAYEVVSAENAHVALDTLQNHANAFDIIVADYNMPGISGLELLKLIRVGAKAISRDIGYAMLTSYSEPHVVQAAFNLDIDSFLKKPVSRTSLRERLTRVLLTNRPVKKPQDYIDIEIEGDALTPRSSSENMVGAKTPTDNASTFARPDPTEERNRGISTELSVIKPNSILCEDLRGPGGKLLVSEGTILTERMLARISDLSDVGFEAGELRVIDRFAQ